VINAFQSEWIRFRKTARIGIVIIIAFTALISIFVFVGTEEAGGPGPPGLVTDLTANNGAVAALSATLNLIGIVSLALFAISVARDFELGTIRNLLVAQPKRSVLLTGKLLALAVTIVIGVVLGTLASAAMAYGLAPGQGIPTDSWTVVAALETMSAVAVAAVVYGLIGAALAMVTRSASTSIVVGVGYLIIAENLLTLIWDTATEWLPAGILAAFAAGGTATVSFGKASTFMAIYTVVALAVTFLVFLKRDITD
jgi:ABC-2 type transport system permease protein